MNWFRKKNKIEVVVEVDMSIVWAERMAWRNFTIEVLDNLIEYGGDYGITKDELLNHIENLRDDYMGGFALEDVNNILGQSNESK